MGFYNVGHLVHHVIMVAPFLQQRLQYALFALCEDHVDLYTPRLQEPIYAVDRLKSDAGIRSALSYVLTQTLAPNYRITNEPKKLKNPSRS